ncbi:MAG: IS1634 family transposase [Woeseiaceae bacterium]
MAKRKRKTQPEARRPKNRPDGQRTYARHGQHILTHAVGALPILNRVLQRMRLKEFLTQSLPPEDKRTKIDTPRVVLLILRNLLVSREPMYGVVEWARNFGPELFDFWSEELDHLNDDRVGRCLERLFQALDTNLIMDVVAHVVREFDVCLDELHNDSTTVSFFGDYPDANQEQPVLGRTAPAITWGHSKDHRPDLKQLLYILTVSEDGGVPVYFQAASGNVVDDQTHQATWRLLAELVQRPDFVYVADCKLATTDNMNEIARQGGRFITVLPATRKEDAEFRRRLREKPETVCWRELYRLTHEDGSPRDVFRVCTPEQVSKEGYRLLWFHSRGKQESDAATRARRLQRAIRELMDLRVRLSGPRTRFREQEKVAAAVDAILDAQDARDFLRVEIEQQQQEKYRQTSRGRPCKNTKYTRQVKTCFDVTWQVDGEQLDQAAAGDGVFPLITNLRDWNAKQVLQAYKRQPIIEKRFSQLKTDFRVAPVYLHNVARIVGLLAIYFFALMVQSLLERELRKAMSAQGIESVPLYPEGRACVRPTTRQLLDVFEPLARHTLMTAGDDFQSFTTELSPLQRQLLKLLRVPTKDYRI